MIVEPNEIKHIKGISDGPSGVTSGCFDLLHFYHLHYLLRCKAECDVLIVGVDSDELVKKNKGNYPAVPEYHRVAMIAALRCVDVAFILRSLDDLKMVTNGTHFLFRNSNQVYGSEVIKSDAELVIIEDVEEVQSTSALKQKIRNN